MQSCKTERPVRIETDGWTNGQTDKRTNGCGYKISPVDAHLEYIYLMRSEISDSMRGETIRITIYI